jgi:YbgC/YbaW family acyl-CoA thioester hydrolase
VIGVAVEKNVFTSTRKTRFSDTDAAGIVFFGNVYAMAHDAYEDLVAHLGFTWQEWFDNKIWGVPIRHSSAEYFRPLRPGYECQIEIRIDKIGETSLTLHYKFTIASEVCCEVRIVHSFISRNNGSGKIAKTPIPSNVRERLMAYQQKCLGT